MAEESKPSPALRPRSQPGQKAATSSTEVEPKHTTRSRARGRGGQSPSPRATIQDVAARAGVTKGTVSKYLNAAAGYYVSTETRERIETAIRELDFEPNAIAQGLSQARTMTIGLLAADIRNPFYPDLVAGAQRVVELNGYTLLLGSTGSDPVREQALVRSFIRRQVDGIILCSARMQVSELETLMQSGVRFVLASRNLPEAITDTVVIDNRAGAELAVDHLVELGHRRIAHLAGPQDVVPFRDRLSGYRGALTRHGIAVDESFILSSPPTAEAGAHGVAQLLDLAAPPTAVFMGNDNMALGAMDEVRKRGLAIPGDLSVIGFDDISVSSNGFIALSSIDSRASLLGEDAATLLLDRLSAGDIPPYADVKNVVHAPVLQARKTTASPR